MNHANVYAWRLDDQVVDLENSIGVSFAGRLRRNFVHRVAEQQITYYE